MNKMNLIYIDKFDYFYSNNNNNKDYISHILLLNDMNYLNLASF